MKTKFWLTILTAAIKAVHIDDVQFNFNIFAILALPAIVDQLGSDKSDGPAWCRQAGKLSAQSGQQKPWIVFDIWLCTVYFRL